MPSVPPPAPPTPPSPDEGATEDSSRLVRVGSGIGAAVIATAIAVLPATLRLSGNADASTLQIWTALIALEMIPMVVAVLVLRQARVGLRAFAGPDASVKAVGVVAWLLLLFAVLVPFGATLRATTHHHALAGVTYALGAVVVALGLAVVCARVTRIVSGFEAPGRRAAAIFGVGTIILAVVVAAFRLSRSPAASAPLGAALVDVLAFALAALFASRAAFADRPRLAVVGPPTAAILVVIGVSALRGATGISGALADHAPAFDPIASVLRSR
jgi:hypothetical protein